MVLIRTKENADSRYSGKVASVIQKFCDAPEILDQLFPSYRIAVHVPKIHPTVFIGSLRKCDALSELLNTVFLIRTK
jgi:hypothetical protein